MSEVSGLRFAHVERAEEVFHRHAEGQVFCLLSGAASVFTEQDEWMMLPGRPCWVPPDLGHGTRSLGAVSGISLRIAPSLAEGLPLEARVLKPSRLIVPLLETLVDEPAMGPDRRQAVMTLLRQDIAAAEEDPLRLPGARTAELRRVLEALARHPECDKGLEDWGCEMGVTARTFVRRFKAETGLTFVAWRQRLRVIRALDHLSAGLPVAETARRVGYASQSGFIALFRVLTGALPHAFSAG